MVTQLTFGDLVRILDRAYGWLRVRSLDDGYEGWVPGTMVESVSEAFISPDQPYKIVKELVAPLRVRRQSSESTIHLCKGARFPVMRYRENDEELFFKIGGIEFRIEERYLTDALPPTPDHLSHSAKSFLNVPYLWGGKSPFGADCSGFTQILFRLHGVSLKRDSYQQATQGTQIAFADRKAGHLAFFKNPQGWVTHVGYLLDAENIIHASGRVRIDRLTAEGIYDVELRTLTHRLHSIRNVLS
jgi:hypothetical protein